MSSLYVHHHAAEDGHLRGTDRELSILIHSSHSLMAKGIMGMLASAPDINLVGHGRSWIETILKIYEFDPSILIINQAGNDGDESNSLAALLPVLSEFPGLKCIKILSRTNHEKEMAALKLGIKGVLLEDSDSDKLIECLTRISVGGLWYRRAVLESFVAEQLFLIRINNDRRPELALPSFTRRELEIIQMAGRRLKNREIGRKLFISEKTVKHHLSKIFKKLRIKKREELKMYL